MPHSATVMQKDEAERVKALLAYEILDTLPDPAFDDIARLAASIARAPYAFIGFIDWARVWFKSQIGFSTRQIPRAGSPCQSVALEGRPALIADAAHDSRFHSRGLRLGEDLYCRSYAAVPLLTHEGAVIGTLAVASPEPGAFSRERVGDLQILANQVMTRLELYASGAKQERVLRARQQAERALTIERNFVSAVLDTISAPVLVVDTTGHIVRLNRASEQLSGYRIEDLAGRVFPGELFLEEDRELALRMFEVARSAKPGTNRELHWRTKGGALRRISWTLTSLENAAGEVSFVILTGVDVTGQREAEEALRSSERRYRQLVENSLGMVMTHSPEGELLSINSHAAAALGWKPEEMAGTMLANYVDAAHAAEFESYLEAVQRNGEHQGVFHLRSRNGRALIVDCRNKLLHSAAGEPFVLGHGVDITEQTEAEQRLHSLMRRHESILESVEDGICGVDLDGRVSFVNRSAAEKFGYAPEAMLGKDLHALVHHSRADGSPYPAGQCPILASLGGASPTHVQDEVFWRKDGTSFPVEYAARSLMNGDRAQGTVVAFQDVTERRRLDRMKDEFIATVSHELRTPLTSLRASLGLIASGALEKRPEKVPQMLAIALGNCDRLIRLVNDIVDFERAGAGNMPLDRRDWSAIELLRRAVEIERNDAAHAGASFRIDAQPLDVWVDGDSILMALRKLIQNAIKFSERGGEIRLGASLSGPQEVTFAVEDHGCGILPENLDLIFDRFQRADASDARSTGGAGLGLAICQSIVKRHGGRIWAESSRGKGSTFHFTVERSVEAIDRLESGGRSLEEVRN